MTGSTRGKRMAIGAVALVGLAALLHPWWRGADRTEGVAPGAAPAVADAPRAQAALAARPDAPTEPVERVAVGVEEPVEPAGEAHPRFRLLGRVVDQLARPLADVRVGLNSVGEPWLSGVAGGSEHPDHLKQSTGADGRFEFEGPLPSSTWISLDLSPGDFHGIAGTDFGLAGGRDRDPLRPGANDLGDIVLDARGAIEGRVLDGAGVGVADARVSLEGEYPGGYVVSTRADEGGSFRLGHVPHGRWGVEVRAEGFVNTTVEQIDVRLGQVTAGVDLELERAPTISGRVVDEGGEPVAGARVWGWPDGSGTGAGARSDERGEFTLSLPHDMPYRLGAKRDGFRELDDSEGGTHPPGSSEVVLRMERPVLSRFSVRDAAGQPVERFGLKVIQVRTPSGRTMSSSGQRVPAPVRDHAGGEVGLDADPALDEYTITAPGFGDRRDGFSFADDGERVVEIVLQPEGVVSGRLVRAGVPVASPTVRVEGDRVPNDPGRPAEELDWLFDFHLDVDEFAGRDRLEQGAPDGTFELRGLAAGTYELTLDGPGVAPQVVELLRVEAGQVLELGDVEAAAPGELVVRVLPPPGASPAGLRVGLGSGSFLDRETAVTTSVSGEVTFGGLAAGTHHVWIEEKTGVVLESMGFPVELAAGESRMFDLDLLPLMPGEVEVLVRAGGDPLPGVRVVALTEVDGKEHARTVGTTDADGVVRGWVQCAAPTRFAAEARCRLRLGATTERVSADPAVRSRVELSVEAGSLTLVMPLPQAEVGVGSVVVLKPRGADAAPGRGIVHVGAADLERSPGGGVRLDLGPMPPGRYGLSGTVGGRKVGGEAQVTAGVEVEAAVELGPPR